MGRATRNAFRAATDRRHRTFMLHVVAPLVQGDLTSENSVTVCMIPL